MSDAPTKPSTDPVARKCLNCRRTFTPERSNHVYCCRLCRRRAMVARKRDSEGIVSHPMRQLSVDVLLAEAQKQRDAARKPRLVLDEFLQARAEYMEAEEQLRRWGAHFQERRVRVEKLKPPRLHRLTDQLQNDKPLTVPPDAVAVGIVSTDGAFGMVVYGCPPPAAPAKT